MSNIKNKLEIIYEIINELEVNIEELKFLICSNDQIFNKNLIDFYINTIKSPFKDLIIELENCKIIEESENWNFLKNNFEKPLIISSNYQSKNEFLNFSSLKINDILKEKESNINENFKKEIDLSFKIVNENKINLEEKENYENNKNSKEKRNYKSIKKRGKRGKYIKFSKQTKIEVLELCKTVDIVKVSDLFLIPLKTINRWITNGIDNKNTGRKISDPDMETKLINFIENYNKINNEIPSNELIMNKAIFFSTNKNFKASKGWLNKFLIRSSDKLKNINFKKYNNKVDYEKAEINIKNYLNILKSIN